MSFSPKTKSKNKISLAFAQKASRYADDNYVIGAQRYFTAQWKQRFKAIGNGDFTQDSGRELRVPMMRAEFSGDDDGLLEKNGKGYKAIAIEFLPPRDGAPSDRFIVIIPADKNVSAKDWLAAQGNNPEWLDPAGFKPVPGTVTLPKFKAKTPPSQPSALGSVYHQAYFQTEETGSEAAAVTIASIRRESIRPPQPRLDLLLDRSFIFATQDMTTGALRTIGVVNDPANNGKAIKPSSPKAGP